MTMKPEEIKSKSEASVMAMRALGMSPTEQLAVLVASIAYLAGLTDKARPMVEHAIGMLLCHEALDGVNIEDVLNNALQTTETMKEKMAARKAERAEVKP